MLFEKVESLRTSSEDFLIILALCKVWSNIKMKKFLQTSISQYGGHKSCRYSIEILLFKILLFPKLRFFGTKERSFKKKLPKFFTHRINFQNYFFIFLTLPSVLYFCHPYIDEQKIKCSEEN